MSILIEAFVDRDDENSFSSVIRGAALVVTALALIACGKAPSEPPAATAKPPTYETVPVPAGGSGTSVPDAASVLTPAGAAKADPAAGRSNNAMSRSQESSAMPVPGQNNDHSAPLGPAKSASGT
jgi:hypothetical protein